MSNDSYWYAKKDKKYFLLESIRILTEAKKKDQASRLRAEKTLKELEKELNELI